MNKLIMMIGAAAVAVGANAATQPATNTVDGVKWQFRIDTDTRTASLGLNIGNVYGNEVAILSSIAGASVRIPSSFAVDGVDYEVTNADNRSFYGLTMKSLIAPETINRWGDYVFRYVTTLQNLYLRGPAVGTIEVTFFINSFNDNTGFKYILIDPTVRPRWKNNFRLGGSSGATIFAPRTGWDGLDSTIGGSDNRVVYYGAGEELDITVNASANTLTATPATANALTNILNAVAVFKEEFGLDTKINITNAFEIGEGLITAENMQYATFNSLMFKVTTQAQFDSILAAVPASVPLAIDASDAKAEIVSPRGRKVYALISDEGRNGKYTPKIKGLIISFF